MTFEQIWQQLKRKQPKLANNDSKVEFEAANLKRLLRQVYEQGQKEQEQEQKSVSASDAGKSFGDFFEAYMREAGR